VAPPLPVLLLLLLGRLLPALCSRTLRKDGFEVVVPSPEEAGRPACWTARST